MSEDDNEDRLEEVFEELRERSLELLEMVVGAMLMLPDVTAISFYERDEYTIVRVYRDEGSELLPAARECIALGVTLAEMLGMSPHNLEGMGVVTAYDRHGRWDMGPLRAKHTWLDGQEQARLDARDNERERRRKTKVVRTYLHDTYRKVRLARQRALASVGGEAAQESWWRPVKDEDLLGEYWALPGGDDVVAHWDGDTVPGAPPSPIPVASDEERATEWRLHPSGRWNRVLR